MLSLAHLLVTLKPGQPTERYPMNEIQQLQSRLDELEMKLAFQEQTIDELNDALTKQQFMIDRMEVQLKFMVGKVKGMQTSNMADESEETPPPHY